MSGYIVFLVLQPLIGLIIAKQADKNGKSFYLWWCYGTVFSVISVIHLYLISAEQDDNNEQETICDDKKIHNNNEISLEAILAEKQRLTDTDWPESYEDYNKYNDN